MRAKPQAREGRASGNERVHNSAMIFEWNYRNYRNFCTMLPIPIAPHFPSITPLEISDTIDTFVHPGRT